MRVRPVDGPISSGYGERRAGGVWHAAWDLAAPAGTPVRAPSSGRIVAVETQERAPFRGYGPAAVVVRGDDGLYHLLAHLDPMGVPRDPRLETRFSPGNGPRVAAGQVVGRVGQISGPHVHWEVRRRFIAPAGQRPIHITIDPSTWLGVAPSAPRRPRPPASSSGEALLWLGVILYWLR